MNTFTHMQWIGDANTGYLQLLDQVLLPTQEKYIACKDVQTIWDAIKRLSVRGAPAIGITAAYGCVVASQAGCEHVQEAANHLATSRPTAVNLFWALDRMTRIANEPNATPQRLLEEAKRIHEEDAAMCERIGEYGLEALSQYFKQEGQTGILTHCNAGALATGGIGTATAPMYLARQKKIPLMVYADETRPLLQGARLTSLELQRAGVDVTLICDNMAAQVMREGRIQAVITGADRIAANGDAANKIGTYSIAVLAKFHNIPFFVAAPSSTFDMQTPDGAGIPIEQRAAEEITHGFGVPTAPEHTHTYSPAFDVTPASLITGIITEKGVIDPVNAQRVREVLEVV